MNNALLPIVLASGSPRRRELMALLGLDYRVMAADVDERAGAAETPADLAGRLSRAKALAVAGSVECGVIIAADTIVVLDGAILGKPAGPDEARRMLRALRGRPHLVLTAIALARRPDGALLSAVVETPVTMRPYRDAEIEAYVASGDPLDKAGAYAIQHSGFNPAARIEGCYANVVGFPLCHVYRALRRLGVDAAGRPVAGCRAATGYACAYYPHVLDGFE
jgi:MAF protein